MLTDLDHGAYKPTMSISFYGSNSESPSVHLHDDIEADLEDPRGMNLSNDNGKAFLRFLSINPGEDLCGQIGVPEARRAIMKARASFDRKAPTFTRAVVVEHGRPRQNEDGTIEMRPIRYISGGIDEGYLAERLERFAVLVEALAARGATSIEWS